jgi:hypothetical protein
LDAVQTLDDRADRRRFPRSVMASRVTRHVRPSDPNWPSAAHWETLNNDVGGQLIKLESPLTACHAMPGGQACQDVLKNLSNPYYLSEQPALTGTTGWVDAWTSTPSVYAMAAKTTRDVGSGEFRAREQCAWS